MKPQRILSSSTDFKLEAGILAVNLSDDQVTSLLQAWQNGNSEAREELFRLIYGQLRRIAQNRLAREGRQHTLQATELVHEIFPQLARQRATWQNRSHFFALASECMRRFLVDHARTRQRQKRGGDNFRVSLSDVNLTTICRIENFDEILTVDKALEKLSGLNKTQALIIKYRYFGGLSREEIADSLQVSPATVDRSYRVAKAWLKRELAFQFSPFLLRPSQILEPLGFMRQFCADASGAAAKSLRRLMPETLLNKIDALRSDQTISLEMLPELIEFLNKMLLSQEFFPFEAMENPALKAGAENPVFGKESDPAKQIRSNRRFLELNFPAYIEAVSQ